MRYAEDEIDEFKYRRALREADETRLVNAAMADILAGRFDTEAVREAMKLGHRNEYPELKDTLDLAERASRSSS